MIPFLHLLQNNGTDLKNSLTYFYPDIPAGLEPTREKSLKLYAAKSCRSVEKQYFVSSNITMLQKIYSGKCYVQFLCRQRFLALSSKQCVSLEIKKCFSFKWKQIYQVLYLILCVLKEACMIDSNFVEDTSIGIMSCM